MSKVIALANQKGGVGKTTTAVQLAAGLADRGKRVLLIDMDPQCNATYIAGVDAGENTILEAMKGSIPIERAVVNGEKYDVVPASPYLSSMEQMLNSQGSEYCLKRTMAPVMGRYDYVIVDAPPTLGKITVNVFTAADEVIIPALTDVFSLQGIGALYGTIQTIRKYSNPGLAIAGILLTRQNERLVHSREIRDMMEETASSIGTKLFKTYIREAVKIREAATSRKSIFDYDKRSNQAQDYNRFVDEYLESGDSRA